MDLTFELLKHVQYCVGGGVVYLDCEDVAKVLNFYQNDCITFLGTLGKGIIKNRQVDRTTGNMYQQADKRRGARRASCSLSAYYFIPA